jgi:hypothetical protein
LSGLETFAGRLIAEALELKENLLAAYRVECLL